MNPVKQLTAISVAVLGFGISAPAQALNLNTVEGTAIPAAYVTYGDANSYSLPVLGIVHDIVVNGATLPSGITPGNPYYVNSTPGAIQDLIVIGTGSNGGPVNTNFTGMDNAYPTPNSDGSVFFSTNKTAYGGTCAGCLLPNDPGQVNPAFAPDGNNTWDIRLNALSGFVGAESPVFFFNNNQTSSGGATDQSLAVWLGLTLSDDAGILQPLNLYLTNNGSAYALVGEGGGGVLNGTAGNGTLGAFQGPNAGDNTSTDYVLSGGSLCYAAPPALGLVSCSSPLAVGGPINHNLGANEAVYAVVFPKLDELLGLGGADPFGGYDLLSIDWRMGCDPNTSNPDVNCVGRSLNNGFEQFFIGTASSVITVPEPSTLALLGSALLGFGLSSRRRRS